jgi:NADH oxidase (H2O-forming)
MKSLQLKKDIYWVGSLDPELRIFDIIMQTEFGTTYNSYVVKGSEKTAIFETVKAKCFNEYIEKLKDIINPADIDYIVVDHTEPDHAGSVEMLLKVAKSAKVVGSQSAIDFLKNIVNHDFDHIVVNHGDTLNLGNKTLKFISAPFLHWPDSIYTYLPEDKILFTCDSFGSHYSFDEILYSKIPPEKEKDYQSALIYYYSAIFSPFKKYVLEAIDKIKDFDIEMILNGHGPVLDKEPMKIVNIYKEWSTENFSKLSKKIIIPYVSAYGYTEQLANKIVEGILSKDSSFEIKKYNINIDNYNSLKPEIMAEIYNAAGVLLGSSTINGDALPPIWDIATSLNPIVHGGKTVSAFGSFGWSGEAVPNIISRLDQIRMNVADGYTVRFKPSIEELAGAVEFGKNFAKYILEGRVPSRQKEENEMTETLNPSGEIKKWRCIVCGEIFEGVLPPQVCPACGVGQEMFEIIEAEPISSARKNSTQKIVIIGSGAAGVAAAENARKNDSTALIEIFSEEDSMPYYRPVISEYLSSNIETLNFYLKPEIWYNENNILLTLNKKAISIDKEMKIITFNDDSSTRYDKLIIANGSRSNVPPILGSDINGVFTLRNKNDADLIKEKAKFSKNVVVVGGGVLGLETACELYKLGLNVSIVEREARIFPRQLDEDGSHILETIIGDTSISLYKNHFTKKINGVSNVESVELDSGKILNADMVIISAGIKCNKELGITASLKSNMGIIVNEYMETSEKDIFACGDIAEFDGIVQGLWATALEQGKIAGANVVGNNLSYTNSIQPVTFHSINTEIFSIGDTGVDPDKSYQTSTYTDVKNRVYKKLYFFNDKFVGGILIGDVSKAGVLLSSIKINSPMSEVTKKVFK